MNEQNEAAPAFHSDQAIRKKADDALNRKGFVKRLSNSIRSIPGDDSLVLALFGDWGSGKSSIKNMMIEELAETSENSPIILEFNPWRLGDENQLQAAFFSEVSKKLPKGTDANGKGGDESKGKKALDRVALWRKYGRYVAFGGTTTKAASKVMGMVGFPGSPLIELLGNTLELTGETLGHGEKAAEAEAEENFDSLTLEEVREALRASFAADDFEQNFLVIIDDIDRLTMPEIAQLVRLVKANSDFPRFVFLLLCEEERVGRALDELAGGEGEGIQYLEKIVQMPFQVPQPSQADIDSYFLTHLNRLLERMGSGAIGLWDTERDQERFGFLYREFLRPFSPNLRSVNRYFNALKVGLSAYAADGYFEANPVDVMALEALRLFEPKAYSQLAKTNSQLLLGVSDYLFGHEEDAAKEPVEAILHKSKETDRVRALLRLLFPPLHETLGRAAGHGDVARSEWRSHRRVCSEDCFARYFELDIRPGDLTESEYRTILESLDDRERIRRIISSFVETKELGLLLSRLEGSEDLKGLQSGPAVNLFTALWEYAEEIREQETFLVPFDGRSQVASLLGGYLRSISEPGMRLEVVRDLIEAAESPGQATYILSRFEADLRGSEWGTPLLLGDAVDGLVKEVLEKIYASRDNDSLIKSAADWSGLLPWWVKHEEQDAKDFVQKNLESAEFLQALLRSSSGTVSSDNRGKFRYISLKSVREFADLDSIKTAIENLGEEKDSELGELVEKFFYSLHREEKGLSQDGADMSMDYREGWRDGV